MASREEIIDPAAGQERCSECGRFAGDGHQCPIGFGGDAIDPPTEAEIEEIIENLDVWVRSRTHYSRSLHIPEDPEGEPAPACGRNQHRRGRASGEAREPEFVFKGAAIYPPNWLLDGGNTAICKYCLHAWRRGRTPAGRFRE